MNSEAVSSEVNKTINISNIAPPNNIYKQMSLVMKELKSVAMVSMQRYKARHIYDVYNMIQPLLSKHNIIIGRELLSENSKDVMSGKGTKGIHRFQVWKFKFFAEDGSSHETTFAAESIDYGDKAASQCDAMSFKQMLIHTFLIPTKDMQEPDDKPEMTNYPRVSSHKKVSNVPVKQDKEVDPGLYKMPNGTNEGVTLATLGFSSVKSWVEYQKKGEPKGWVVEALAASELYLHDLDTKNYMGH